MLQSHLSLVGQCPLYNMEGLVHMTSIISKQEIQNIK